MLANLFLHSAFDAWMVRQFPPGNGAPVLAAVEQTALDGGCGSALVEGVGNGSKNGYGGRLRLA